LRCCSGCHVRAREKHLQVLPLGSAVGRGCAQGLKGRCGDMAQRLLKNALDQMQVGLRAASQALRNSHNHRERIVRPAPSCAGCGRRARSGRRRRGRGGGRAWARRSWGRRQGGGGGVGRQWPGTMARHWLSRAVKKKAASLGAAAAAAAGVASTALHIWHRAAKLCHCPSPHASSLLETKQHQPLRRSHAKWSRRRLRLRLR
jgi:hypothetical protein